MVDAALASHFATQLYHSTSILCNFRLDQCHFQLTVKAALFFAPALPPF